MTNKPMLSVERELLVRLCNLNAVGWEDIEPEMKELRALLDKQSCGACGGCDNGCKLDRESPAIELAAQHQVAPVAEVNEGDDGLFIEFIYGENGNPLKRGDKLYLRQSEQPESVAAVPEGYCIMPRRLTAENGAKALLLGEFTLKVTMECSECCELEEPSEGCEICDGEGEYGQKHTIPWDQIKFIYSEAVRGLARPNVVKS